MDPGFLMHSVWLNAVVFLVSTAIVWFAGTRLARFAKAIADQTRLGEAFIGTLLLGAVVSLPEMAMALAAAAMGNAKLAVNTLLGGIVFVILILAGTDAIIGGKALSLDVQRPVVPLQGALVILMLVIAAAGISLGDIPVLGVGAWSSGLLAIYVLILVIVKHTQTSRAWVVRDPETADRGRRHGRSERHEEQPSVRRAAVLVSLAALAILVAGLFAAITGDVLAQQTGLGASFVGFVLGGLVTSLPEASSTYSAVRLRKYEMAYSDAFGTNMFSVMLLFFCDAVFPGGPVLNEGGRFSLFATLLGAAVTAVCVAGLIGRPRKVVLRMGVDSILVVLVSVGGFLLLYRLR